MNKELRETAKGRFWNKVSKNPNGCWRGGEVEAMLCYKDMTFCSYYKECKDKDCIRALTPEVEESARKFGLPISHFAERPDCKFLAPPQEGSK